MLNCPDCNKELTHCASWWPMSSLCILTHQALDCSAADSLTDYEELGHVNKTSPENEEEIKSLALTFEKKFRIKATSPGNVNDKALKKLSMHVAYEIVAGKESQKMKETLQKQLREFV